MTSTNTTPRYTETTHLVWYCGTCKKPYKTKPPAPDKLGCRCTKPVPGMRPTRITQVHRVNPPRRLHALTDEEARLRALARKGKQVRVTYEAEVADVLVMTREDGSRHVTFIVATADGRRHVADPDLPGLHIEAAPAGDEPPPAVV